MHLTLIAVGNLIVWSALIAAALGRISGVQSSGIIALGCIPSIAAFAMEGTTTVASVFAALGSIHAWIWRNGGGGDGTKRRLKLWVSRFQGVRRTAPTHS